MTWLYDSDVLCMHRSSLCSEQINGKAVAMAMDAENRPWIHLAGALGKLARQLIGDNVSQNASISIVTRGTTKTLRRPIGLV